MGRIGTAANHDIKLAAGLDALIGAVETGLHLNLFHGIRIGAEFNPAGRVGEHGAIDKHEVVGLAHAAEIHEPAWIGPVEAGSAGDARNQARQRGEVAHRHGYVFELSPADDLGTFGGFGIESGG